jgi:hypothetical protein
MTIRKKNTLLLPILLNTLTALMPKSLMIPNGNPAGISGLIFTIPVGPQMFGSILGIAHLGTDGVGIRIRGMTTVGAARGTVIRLGGGILRLRGGIRHRRTTPRMPTTRIRTVAAIRGIRERTNGERPGIEEPERKCVAERVPQELFQRVDRRGSRLPAALVRRVQRRPLQHRPQPELDDLKASRERAKRRRHLLPRPVGRPAETVANRRSRHDGLKPPRAEATRRAGAAVQLAAAMREAADG